MNISVLPHVLLSCSHDSLFLLLWHSLSLYFVDVRGLWMELIFLQSTDAGTKTRRTLDRREQQIFCFWDIETRSLSVSPEEERKLYRWEVLPSKWTCCVRRGTAASREPRWHADVTYKQKGFSHGVRGKWLHLCNLHLTFTLLIKG